MWVFPKIGVPLVYSKINGIPFISPQKGYPSFRKPPYSGLGAIGFRGLGVLGGVRGSGL